MFTGLIEGCGTVAELRRDDEAVRLTVDLPDAMHGPSGRACRVGESIAVNGCCLTVVEVDAKRCSFQAGPETLAKTNLGRLQAGDAVNLERALPADGRLGGHFVQGHIDGLGAVDAVAQHADWLDMGIAVDPTLAAQMVPKGSVAVDGVSLTLVTVARNRFTVALIPHTLNHTTLGGRTVGETVNIETDILGKYVQKFLHGVTGLGGEPTG